MSITFISAGAGSGKTHNLTILIEESLASGTKPERIMATTFTNKEAEEIRTRVTSAFFKRGDLRLVEAAPALLIGTVNAVCGQLLARFAFEAGISPRLRVIEPAEADSLLGTILERTVSEEERHLLYEIEGRFGLESEDAWMSTARKLVGEARGNAIGAAELRGMAAESADGLIACLGREDETRPITNIAVVAGPDRTGELRGGIERALPLMEAAQSLKYTGTSDTYIKECRKALRGLKTGRCSWRDWVTLSRDKSYGVNLREVAGAVSSIAATFASQPRLHADIRDYVRLCFEAAAASLEGFKNAKDEAGLIDFVDQESRLYELLELPLVQERLKEELELLLVDEFQDTSPIQLAVFLRLSRLAKKTYWVGDIKQSIYGFRGSDARLMKEILGGLEGLGADIRILGDSWRSRPALVELTNALFVPAFAAELKEDQVRLSAQRSEYSTAPVFEHWLLASTRQSQRETGIAEAIKDLLASGFTVSDKDSQKERPVEARDIAVLVRSNATAAGIRAALKSAGLQVGGGATVALARPEGALLLACLRRLNDPRDSLASAEILGLSEGLSPEAWLPERLDPSRQAAPERWRCEGKEANLLLAAIEGLRPLAASLSPSELASALVGRCGLDRIVASWASDAEEAIRRIAALDSLLSLIEDFEQKGSTGEVSLSGLILWLDGKATKAREEKAAKGTWKPGKKQDSQEKDEAIGPSAEPGVQVLTWHGAKGLEWPVCICHDTTKEIRERTFGLSVRPAAAFDIDQPLAGRRIRFWPWPFGALKNVDEGLALERDPEGAAMANEASAEERRVLYVGFTRARDLLVQTLELPKEKKETTKKKGGAEDTPAIPKPTTLSTLGAAASLVEARQGSDALALPNGASIPYACRVFEEGEAGAGLGPAQAALSWPIANSGKLSYPAALVTPSKQKEEKDRLREREEVSQSAQAPSSAFSQAYAEGNILRARRSSRELGSVYHALVAWAVANPGVLGDATAITIFLDRQGASESFDAIKLHVSVKALLSWIAARWPGSLPSAEVPFSVRIATSQLVSGQIDLLVETAEGPVIIDHKLVGRDEARESVADWKEQLGAYVKAVETAGGRKVAGLWVNLAEEGRMVGLG